MLAGEFPSFDSIESYTSQQRDEDAIVGRMIRELIRYEGKPMTTENIAAIEGIVVQAQMRAKNIGGDMNTIEAIARRISFSVSGGVFDVRRH